MNEMVTKLWWDLDDMKVVASWRDKVEWAEIASTLEESSNLSHGVILDFFNVLVMDILSSDTFRALW